MNREVTEDGRVVERWDDATRLHTTFDASGAAVKVDAYTPEENAAADARATAEAAGRTAATIRQQASTALTNNAAYLALGTRTTAQVAAQVEALTRQMNGVIRLLLGRLESAE